MQNNLEKIGYFDKKIPKKFWRFKKKHYLCDIGVWCNGNTTDSGPVILGSSPSTPTKEIAKSLKTKHLAIFLFRFWRDFGVIDSNSAPILSPQMTILPRFSVTEIQRFGLFQIDLVSLGLWVSKRGYQMLADTLFLRNTLLYYFLIR